MRTDIKKLRQKRNQVGKRLLNLSEINAADNMSQEIHLLRVELKQLTARLDAALELWALVSGGKPMAS